MCLQQGPRDFSGVRGGREGAPEEACANKSERPGGVERGERDARCARETERELESGRGLASWKRRRSVRDSERAKLCKIVAQGGERGEQACKGACKRLGGCCVCWGEGRVGRAEGPGEGEGLLEGGRWWNLRASPSPAAWGTTPIRSGSGLTLYGSVCPLLPRIDPSLLLHPPL